MKRLWDDVAMRLLYFVAGAIAIVSLATALGAFAFASAFGGGDTPAIGFALLGAAAVAGSIAWWASRKGAERWPH